MPLFLTTPFEDLVAKATDEHNVTEDWSLILDICDRVVNYEEGSKYCLQAIGKRLHHKVPRVVAQSLVLLDACVKNCGKKFHLEISSRYFVDQIPKLLSKMHESTASSLKQLIKKWSEKEFKDDPELGLLPSLYYKLKSEGYEFPQEADEQKKPAVSTDPNVVSSQEEEEDIIKAIALSLNETSQSGSTLKEDSTNSLSFSSPAEICKVRALYDFEAVEDNELTIMTGEIVIVIDKSNGSWWKGNNHRGEGYFPANFTTENLDEQVKETSAQDEETLPKQIDDDDIPSVIDELKIRQTLDCLNELDPTLDMEDPEDLIASEKQCYAMSSLIEDKLQYIDRKCTSLNAINVQLVEAIQLFYGFSSGGGIGRSEKASSLNRQQFVPQHYYMLNEASNPMSMAMPPSSQAVLFPVAHPSQHTSSQYSSSSLPYGVSTFCYNPVVVMAPHTKIGPVTDSSSSSQTTVTDSRTTTARSMGNIPTDDEIRRPPVVSESGYHSKMSSMMYQTVLMPQHPSQNTPPVLSHYTSLPIQHPSTFIHPQALNSYMPNYIAQVSTPSNNSQIHTFTGVQPKSEMCQNSDGNTTYTQDVTSSQNNILSSSHIKTEPTDDEVEHSLVYSSDSKNL